jgi:UDP-glucose 4-epimerase
MKSITLGSNGYLGRHLAYFLRQYGFENRNYDLHAQLIQEIGDYESIDITRREDLAQLDADVDFIFLFAGITGTAEGFDRFEEYVSVNEIGLLNVLTWMRETGCRARVVFPSTRLVYKGRKHYALKEDDPKEAKTIYAANKITAENMLRIYHNTFDINFTIFRICVPYGNLFGDAYSYGTLGFFLDQARSGNDITLFGDGSIRRTFTHVEDICHNIIKAVRREGTANEVFNIGGEDLSLKEAATLIATKFGVQVKYIAWPEMAMKLESDDTVFDGSRLQALVQYENKHSVKEWLTGWLPTGIKCS